MSNSQPRASDRVKLRITTQLEASKQFLVILIGLAVANAVAEKLKYSLEGSVLGLRATAGDVPLNQFPPQIRFLGNDTLYDVLFNSKPDYTDLFVLFVFFVYVTRFFFNNYTYLSENYGESALRSVGTERAPLLSLKLSSTYDLALSVFTGIIVCLVSMVLAPRRIVILMGFVVLHYIVDGALLFASTARFASPVASNKRSISGATDEIERERLRAKRAAWWIGNNAFFSVVFLILIGVIYMAVADRALNGGEAVALDQLTNWYGRFSVLWLLNCLIAYLITWYYGRKEEGLANWDPIPAERQNVRPAA